VEAGKLRVLGSTGAKRYASLPNVPAIAETLPGYSVDIWSGFVMPQGVPKAIVDKANSGLRQALESPDVQAIFAKQGVEVATSTPAEMAATIRADLARWAKVVKDANIKPE
jgi:tripartite-type tricarboxylate transporter receptor subunit TctC